MSRDENEGITVWKKVVVGCAVPRSSTGRFGSVAELKNSCYG